MNSYSRIIKAHDVKLTDLQEESSKGFVRGLHNQRADEPRREEKRPPEEQTAAQEEITLRNAEEKRAAEKKAAEKKAHDDLLKGLERDRENLSAASESVAKLMREVESLKDKIMVSAEQEILDLAFLIAEKVIHKEVSVDREVILSVLRDAMRAMKGKDDVRIRMNPEDYRHITEANPDFLGSYGEILIERDETIGRGGAVLETHAGVVDARLDRQLDKIRDTLYDEHRF